MSKYTQTENGVLQGLLYVPDLARDDPCKLAERAYVSDLAVRQGNLPSTNYNLIALAPWFNVNCTQSYLASARYDPLRAMIFYLPTNDTAKPPGPNAEAWNLLDDGAWKTENHFPIFAISGALGAEMMYQLSLYSGNLKEVPFGENISEIYNPDPNDYVRIWTELTVSTPTGLPNVWVFILAVIGVLLAVISLTSLFMHFLWRRRRTSLQRRVAQGEINLEAMGIRRLAVPFGQIQQFPLFTYNYDAPLPRTPSCPSVSQGITTSLPADRPVPEPSKASLVTDTVLDTHNPGDLDYQPLCQICLEPYQNRLTIIRELSCGHIFHPECIDEFLGHVSSLCPLCKACMLPKGYSPRVTNAMVRRERAIRRLRERVVVEDVDSFVGSRGFLRDWGSHIKKRLHSATSWLPISMNFGTISETSTELKKRPLVDTQSLAQLPSMSTSEATRSRMARLAGINLGDLQPRDKARK